MCSHWSPPLAGTEADHDLAAPAEPGGALTPVRQLTPIDTPVLPGGNAVRYVDPPSAARVEVIYYTERLGLRAFVFAVLDQHGDMAGAVPRVGSSFSDERLIVTGTMAGHRGAITVGAPWRAAVASPGPLLLLATSFASGSRPRRAS